ncbi:hypothetical protein LX36DRAFT_282380 [Colletotrichum falcatum]|nr:hypothetical protein LX36DRAFT_282380 [Colletotrichum falcatum]
MGTIPKQLWPNPTKIASTDKATTSTTPNVTYRPTATVQSTPLRTTVGSTQHESRSLLIPHRVAGHHKSQL